METSGADTKPIEPIAPTIPPPDEATSGSAHQFPLPRSLIFPSSRPPRLVTQGAEGRLYATTHVLPTRPCALKHRPSKPYRHPILDARLTRHRILSEARILQKCRRDGVPVPALYAVDEAAGCLAMEWVPGQPVRVRVNQWIARRRARLLLARGGHDGGGGGYHGADPTSEVAADEDGVAELKGLLARIGEAVGRLHKSGVVHGDLTTSNMMLRPWEKGKEPTNGYHASAENAENADGQEQEGDGGDEDDGAGILEGEIVIIDFGLASQGTADEDRAVDLYVLERAFGSTHPKAEGLFSVVLDAYRGTFKAAPVVLKKLEDVRMRGRKRTMLG